MVEKNVDWTAEERRTNGPGIPGQRHASPVSLYQYHTKCMRDQILDEQKPKWQWFADHERKFVKNLFQGKVNMLKSNFRLKTNGNVAKNGHTEHFYQYNHGKSEKI